MAINVDTVYKTVLLILNKEQRGYITPDEFNKTATQVQLDIFEQYFDDLNQQLRVPQADFDFTDRQMNIDEKISYFKAIGNCSYNTSGGFWQLPSSAVGSSTFNIRYSIQPSLASGDAYFYRLGTITYTPASGYPVELQRLQRNDFYNIDQSPLTRPTKSFPCYLYEGNRIYVKPTDIQTGAGTIEASIIRKPLDVVWGFITGGAGQYVWSPTDSRSFELEQSEQVNVTLRILQYSGIVIRDPQIIQAASSEIAQSEANSKS
jgi:hypothetical protein